jgi:hypothetical protein
MRFLCATIGLKIEELRPKCLYIIETSVNVKQKRKHDALFMIAKYAASVFKEPNFEILIMNRILETKLLSANILNPEEINLIDSIYSKAGELYDSKQIEYNKFSELFAYCVLDTAINSDGLAYALTSVDKAVIQKGIAFLHFISEIEREQLLLRALSSFEIYKLQMKYYSIEEKTPIAFSIIKYATSIPELMEYIERNVS